MRPKKRQMVAHHEPKQATCQTIPPRTAFIPALASATTAAEVSPPTSPDLANYI